MTDRCESLDAYVDDELTADERTQFESHLATCDACSAELPRLLALMAAFDGVAIAASASRPHLTLVSDEPSDVPAPARDRPRRVAAAPAWRRTWLAGAGVVALAAALLLWLRPSPDVRGPALASLERELGPTRPFDSRLSYPGTEAHRELDVQRGAVPDQAPDHWRQLLLQAEQAENWHAAAVIALYAGDRGHAAAAFARAAPSVAVDSDRAAFEISEGNPERALEAADRALAASPKHTAARWNRGLALIALNLPLAAAVDFEAVAALGEPGWAGEARTRATELRAQVRARREHWTQVKDAARNLTEHGTPIPDPLTDVTGYMTLRLYDAVRAAPSRAAVEALLPLAQRLDSAYRSDHLAAYVRRIAAADFRARKPLADAYRELVLERMPASAFDAFLTRLDKAGPVAEDLWLGALVRTRRVADRLDDYRRRVTASGDPWLITIAEHETAKAEIARGERVAAEARMRDAIAFARRARLAYRAVLLEVDLVELYRHSQKLAQAHDEARIAHRDATSLGEAIVETKMLDALIAINLDRYANGLARAYLTELRERTDSADKVGPSPLAEGTNCEVRKYAFEALANMSIQDDVERARSELSLAPPCNGPTARGTLVRSDLYRLQRRDEDLQIARADLARLRAEPNLTPAMAAMLSYIEGTLLIDDNRSAGQRALREAIAQADHHVDDYNYAVKARAYSFSMLALDAGRASEFPRVLDILAETLEVARPQQCAVAIATQDERSVVAIADARGQVDGQYVVARTIEAPDVTTLVPERFVERLRACERVVVLARAPVFGAARVLPPQLAWSYLLKGSAPAPSASRPRRLVVANPEPPPALKLAPLRPYSEAASADTVVLRGADATPTRVLLGIRDASVIELHTHGFIGNDVSEASYLVLSTDVDRQYAMTASDVARVKLEAAPLVILGACHAAQSSRSKEGGIGLPEAFLRSGARAVIASPEPVGDRTAQDFFAGIRDRVSGGADPVIALRDERLQRLAKSHDDAWVTGVVVFE